MTEEELRELSKQMASLLEKSKHWLLLSAFGYFESINEGVDPMVCTNLFFEKVQKEVDEEEFRNESTSFYSGQACGNG